MENNALRNGVISSLIAGVLLLVIIPLLRFIWKFTIAITSAIHQGWTDRIYRIAARGETNMVGVLTLALLFWVAGSVWLVFAQQKSPSTAGIARLTTSITLTLIMMLALATVSIAEGVNVASEDFTQRLTILAPSISDQEYKTFRAKWANMHSEADYDAIVNAMNKRAHELNIALPALRW